jgi:hypothetical protein
MRPTERREPFDGWLINKDEGRIVFDVEYSVCLILVEDIELLIIGVDLKIKTSFSCVFKWKE